MPVQGAVLSSAFITAVFHVMPNLRPFFSPGEWAVAGKTDLLRTVFFFNIFQSNAGK